jgi:hypothetical protein
MDRVHLNYDAILRWAFRPGYRRTWIPKLTVVAWARSGFARAQLRLDRVAIRNRAIVLWIAALTLAASFGLLATGAVKSEFVLQTDEADEPEDPDGRVVPAYTMSKAEQVEAACANSRRSSASRASGRIPFARHRSWTRPGVLAEADRRPSPRASQAHRGWK